MNTPYPIRPDVLAMEPYSPGLSIDEIRARFGLDSVIKMASNENPAGVSPVVRKVLCEHAAYAFRYAQSGNPELVAALGRHHGMDKGHFIPGNGSDEIIDLLLRVCPTPGRHNVVASRPSFSMYRIQSRLCGLEFRDVPLRADFSFDWQGLADAVDANTALLFITTPDNPSGYCPPVAETAAFARSLPDSCLLVVDEAYMDFCRRPEERSLLPRFDEFPNLVVLRTFSKAYGLAGLRLGYGIMPLPLAEAMRRAHMPFSVNILAEKAGIAALADSVFHEYTVRTVDQGRRWLAEELAALGCRVHPSQANFLMFELPPGCAVNARGVFEKLLSRGLIIRPLASYSLPEHLRVSVGTKEENRRFIELLREALA
ncbi:histidinol-phosphate transaminase [Desulfovibrio sp. OttesenSCG-928-A18]|nr:histidinol-phosphate transaminase [Desulfovibrio sp. OttesenSCG-928-A18]